MTPSQILTELRGDHARLRGMVANTRRIADRARQGAPETERLLQALTALTAAVQNHCHREEELLSRILRTVDAWGPARVEIMSEEHVQQHHALYRALLHLPRTPTEFAGAGVADLLEELLDHMRHEEDTFLNAEVLNDEGPFSDAMSG